MGKNLSVGFPGKVYPGKEAFSLFTCLGKRLSVCLPALERGFQSVYPGKKALSWSMLGAFDRFTLGKMIQSFHLGKEAFSLFTLGKRLSVGLPCERGFQWVYPGKEAFSRL